MNKQPLRMCVACRKMKEKSKLIKVVKNKNGEYQLDEHCNKEGRGAYVCKDAECLELCLKKRCFNRAFKCNVEEKFYNEIKDKVDGCK